MSQQYDNNLRGVLFKNDRKENEKHPDYKGSCEIEGNEYWLSAWIRSGDKGKFMSLSFTLKEEKKAPPKRPQQKNGGAFDDMDSDVPF